MSKLVVDLNKTYKFPEEVKIITYKDRFLAIAPLFANWIVIENNVQKEIFLQFQKGNSIGSIIEQFNSNFEDINYIVTQLEAREFCSKKVSSNINRIRNLHIYLTNKCNLQCPHCYMFSGLPNENELTGEEIKKVIKEYKKFASGERITLSGGEPTVHVDFEDILKFAHELGLEIKLLTNGINIDETNITKISKYISSVQVSIDGFSETSNAIIRGKNNFERALNCVDLFINNNVETSIAVTPFYKDLDRNIDEYVEFALKLRNKYANKPFSIKFASELSSGRKIQLTEAQNKKYYEIVKQIQQRIYTEDISLIEFIQTFNENVILENCMFGVFSIASNGDVYLCPEITTLKPIGNIRTESFEEIINLCRKVELYTSVRNISPCNQCDIRFICGGGCRIKEFPVLKEYISIHNLENLNLVQECNAEKKEHFYELMILSNEYLFVNL